MAPPPGVGSLDAVAATKSITRCSTKFITRPHVKAITRYPCYRFVISIKIYR